MFQEGHSPPGEGDFNPKEFRIGAHLRKVNIIVQALLIQNSEEGLANDMYQNGFYDWEY